MKNILPLALTLSVVMTIFPGSARADVAPPDVAPGVNVGPGNAATEVRMVAETVTITVLDELAEYQTMLARTEAVFTMRNLGTVEEHMPVRFPLSFFGDSYQFPELASITVRVDGSTVETRREIQPWGMSPSFGSDSEEVPWAVFDVTFPPDQDVTIEVSYTVQGFGYYPYEKFKYVLESGAGWRDTIGSAEIVVRLPYEVNAQNTLLETSEWLMETSTGGIIRGNELYWSLENLEPSAENNIEVVLLGPPLWNTVQQEMQSVSQNPNDGEAWHRLAAAYQEVITVGKGQLRDDPAGREMFELSASAYEKCFALQPDNAQCHVGYADLLWSYYYFDIYWLSQTDTDRILPTVLTELQTALTLDPNNQEAKDSLRGISNAIPEAVIMAGDDFVLLGLTATPIPPTPYVKPVMETPLPTLEPVPLQTAVPTPTATTPGIPLCGGLAVLPVLSAMVFVLKKKTPCP